jgi:hypothetical protein
MLFKKCKHTPEPEEEPIDMEPVTPDDLSDITGAGNPWDKVKGVKKKKLKEEVRDKV